MLFYWWWGKQTYTKLWMDFFTPVGTVIHIKIMFGNLQELLQLEEDVKLLEEMYPQGEKVMVINYATFCF